MAIDYKVVEKGQPGVVGGGEIKFYTQIVYGKEATVDELVKNIEKFSALSESDIRGVIYALENVAQGRIVRLEKLGSFYPTISSQGETEEKRCLFQLYQESKRELQARHPDFGVAERSRFQKSFRLILVEVKNHAWFHFKPRVVRPKT